MEVLKQDQFQPLRVAQQIAIIFAGTNGFLDDVEVALVRDFENGLYAHIEVNDAALWDDLEAAGKLDDDLEARLRTALDDYKSQGGFATVDDAEEEAVVVGTEEEAAAVVAEDQE